MHSKLEPMLTVFLEIVVVNEYVVTVEVTMLANAVL